MRTRADAKFSASLVAAAAILAMAVAVPSAQRRGGGNANAGIPIATGTLLANPDSYYGKVITVSAGIEQVLSNTAFVVDQRKMVSETKVAAVGKPVLIIAPELSEAPDPKHYIMVKGQVVKFDAAAIAQAAPGYTFDLSADARARFAGQPVLVATSVIDSVFREIGRRPLRPAEVSLATAMKAISPASAALRAATQQSKGDEVAANVEKLAAAFADSVKIWETLGAAVPAQWSREARQHALRVQAAAAAGNWEAAKEAYGALNQTCANCHSTYRQALDDGTYRIKNGTI